MRFGKKRGWNAIGRIPSDTEKTVWADEIAAEQRTAPLMPQPEEKSMVSPQEDDAVQSGDPIQQLLSTLGKLQRFITMGQHQPESAEWCDACMGELMTGLEISLANNYTPVKDAMIDAARILHSYERVGRASMCLPFLKESHDLLSLMVGDLIVDQVRSGVKQKWREHYIRAVDALEARGIDLVEDEEEEAVGVIAPSAAQPMAMDEGANAGLTWGREVSPEYNEDVPAEDDFETACDAPSVHREEDAAGSVFDEIPIDLPPLSEESMEDADEQESSHIVPFPASGENLHDEAAAVEDETVPEESREAAFDPSETILIRQEDVHLEEERFDDPIVSRSDDFPAVEEDEEEPREETGGKPSLLSEEGGESAPSEVELSADKAEEDHVDSVRMETSDSENSSVVLQEEESLFSDEPATEEQAVSGPEALLLKAREAMKSGDIRNAKSVALELAVSMARLEYEQAGRELAGAEQRLLDNAKAIETAETSVVETESQLSQTEELLAARDAECGACRERIGMIDEELGEMAVQLSDIEKQIAVLQQQRQEQQHRMVNKQVEREESVGNESRAQTEMESLAQEMEAVRASLDDAREVMQNKKTERRAIEGEIMQIREELESRRLSLEAIARTLHPGAASLEPTNVDETLL